MTRYYRSYLGAWVLAFTFVFRVLLMLYLYDRFVKIFSPHSTRPVSFLDFISGFEKISLCLLVAELIIYLVIRNRIYRIQWVRLHVWPLLFAFVIMPMTMVMLRILSLRYANPEGVYVYLDHLSRAQFYIFWGLVAVGHAFFIATIAKSFTPKTEPADEGPPGILDEFVD